VVGLRLGCLNHALLTAQAIAGRGLKLAGWIANCLDPHMLAREQNLTALQERLQLPPLGVIAFEPNPLPRSVASRLAVSSLI
ncbi:MAG: ATP-dependent dethiobiotin synthetase BioD, partial [Pseudomonas sp.]